MEEPASHAAAPVRGATFLFTDIDRARAMRDAADLAAAWSEGRSMTADEAEAPARSA